MSWDLFAMNFPSEARSMDDIPSDFKPEPLGSRATLIHRIQEVVPTANFSDPTWGVIDGGDWSIEVNLGSEEECTDFALHVRGNDDVVGVVADILAHLKVRAFDPQTCEFFALNAEGLESLRKWRAYRDKALSGDG